MAEILIRATNNTNGHPLAWQRGMPVFVAENGWAWGTREIIPPAQGGSFVIVKIPDVTVAQVTTFLANRWGIDLCDEEYDLAIPSLHVRRRHIRLRVDDLPANVRNQLNNTGTYTTTWDAIRSFIQRIRTGENA